jgi:hypothetical protein
MMRRRGVVRLFKFAKGANRGPLLPIYQLELPQGFSLRAYSWLRKAARPRHWLAGDRVHRDGLRLPGADHGYDGERHGPARMD